MKNRRLFRWVAIVQISLTMLTGCAPTQPFFKRNNPSLANYLDQAMSIEYADVHVESLPEATQTYLPFSHERMPDQFHDWTLEECISIGLNNAKMLPNTPGINLQSGSMASSLLSAQPGQIPSIYDPALVALTGNTQPLTVDSQGVRVSQRGSTRANQVGGVEQALSEFDAQYSSILSYQTTDRARNVGRGNVFNPQQFQAKDGNLQNAISKRLATGTVVTARTTTSYSRNNIPASFDAAGSGNFGRSVPSDWTQTIEMQINQPLMRGRGTLVNRIPVQLARINEENATHQFEVNVRNLLRDIEHSYWDLYVGYRAVETARTAYESALDLYRVAEKRAENSDTSPAAVAQAAGRVALFRAQLVIAIEGSNVPGNDPLGLIGRERVLREKLGLAATDGYFIRPSDMPSEARIAFEWESVLSEGLCRNTELRISKWAVKQRELEHISARNQLLPQLDVVGTYRWLGVGDELSNSNRNGRTFPQPGSSALEELSRGNYQEVGARLEYTPVPFGARREKANINASLFNLKKSHEELKEKERDLSLLLSTTWTSAVSSFASAKNFLDQIRENDAEINVYMEQIASDSGDIHQVLDAMLRATELKARAELQYYQSLTEYNKSIVNVHYLKGSLLDLNNVTLGEGAWVEKAYCDAELRARERAGGLYFDYGYTRPSVMSTGPVQSGGVTEGNISDNASRPLAPIVDAEEIEAKESDEKRRSILDSDEADSKSTGRQLKNRRPSISSTGTVSSVRPAGGEAPIVQANQFHWGEMGMSEPSSLRPAESHQLRKVPREAVTTDVTESYTNELRESAPLSVSSEPSVPLSTARPVQSASIQWKSRNQ